MEFTPITGTALHGIAKAVGHPVGNAEIASASFYMQGDVITIDGQRYVAAGDGPVTGDKLVALTGFGAAIREANKVAGLSITDDTVIDYLAFFNLNTIDEGSNFFVFLADKQFEGRMVTEPRVEKKDDNYVIECFVMHADELWNCKYIVSTDGDVEMVYGNPAEDADLPAVH